MGAIGSTARSLVARCRTELVLPVRPDSFAKVRAALASNRSESWPCSRLLPTSWPWRSLAAYCWSGLARGDMRSIAPYCCVPGNRRSLVPSGVFPLRARTSCSACLDSLRPSERRSVSQAWSRCRSGGMQGWSDWSGAGAKLASQACAGRTGLILGAKRVPMPCSGRMSSKCQLCEGACRTGHRAKRPSKPAAPAALRTIVRVAAIFPLPDTRAR